MVEHLSLDGFEACCPSRWNRPPNPHAMDNISTELVDHGVKDCNGGGDAGSYNQGNLSVLSNIFQLTIYALELFHGSPLKIEASCFFSHK